MRTSDQLYILRVWRDGQSHSAWRASLKNLKTEELTQFRSLDDLTSHLRTEAQQDDALSDLEGLGV